MRKALIVMSILAGPGAAPSIAAETKGVPLAPATAVAGDAATVCRASKSGRAGGPVAWRVARASTASSGVAIAETSQEATDTKYPICVFDSIVATDVEISVDLTPRDGKLDRAGGLIVRRQDDNNYYLVRSNALEDNVRLYQTFNGVRRQIGDASLAIPSGKTHRLGLRVLGDEFTVLFDGKQLYRIRHGGIAARGAVGLWSKADSLVEFSSLSVTVLKE